MKKKITLFLIAIIAAAALSGCSQEKVQQETTAETQATETVKNSLYSNSSKMLSEYCKSFTKGKNPLYGTWTIEGSDVPSFIFRNDDLGEMAMGSEGSFASLSINTDKKTLSATFFVGINGDYSYSLSDNDKKLTLTEVKTGSTVKLIRKNDYNFVPDAPKKVVIDKNILGWWKGDNGQKFYFGSDGLMYSNQISIETFYTYKAKKGKISAVYDYGDDVKINLSYKVKNKKLTIDGSVYKPCDKFD